MVAARRGRLARLEAAPHERRLPTGRAHARGTRQAQPEQRNIRSDAHGLDVDARAHEHERRIFRDGCIDAGGWRDKPRARQQCVDAVVRMLSFGVAEGGLSESWQISQASKLKLKGSGKSKNPRPVMELTDAQVLQLIDACPTAEWQNCLLVMATYGLRPIEVTELTVRRNPDTNKKQLFCTYRKACGGRSQKMETQPRFLWPMPVLDENGEERNGDLTAAFEAGLLPFPTLKEKGEAISQYLRRLKLWRDWQTTAAANGMDLRPYSFRNSYSVRCHARGIPSAMVAEAMGHSDKTHNEHYLTTTGRATAEAFISAVT